MPTISRTEIRAGFADEVRLRLLEQDADRADIVHEELAAGQRSIQRTLTQVLAGVTTASILLAINIAVQLAVG